MRAGSRVCAVFAAVLAIAAEAVADPADDFRTETLKKSRQALEDLGAWCGEQKLLRKRAAIAEALLSIDAEHDQARAWLQFKRDKRGDWVRAASVVPPVDGRSDDWPEWVARRTEVLDPVRKNLEAACDFSKFSKTPGRERTLRLLVALYPDDEKLRAKHGEVRVGGRWVLAETAATAEGRKRVEGWVKEALKAAGAKEPVVERKVAGDEVDWACSATLGEVFVATTGNAKEVSAFTTRLFAARRLVDAAMARPGASHAPLRCDLLGNYWENKRYLEKCAELSEADRKKFADWNTWWRTWQRMVVWGDEPAERLDGALRRMIHNERSRFSTILAAPVWLNEGLGLYLTWRLVGTRLTWFRDPSKYAEADRAEVHKELLQPTSDWIALARKIAQKQGGPRLPILAGMSFDGMTAEDDVMAFAVAAYLLECRHESVAMLFQAAAMSPSIEYALTTSLGLDLESLDWRFGRWLEETR
jgi:hypothetical protein